MKPILFEKMQDNIIGSDEIIIIKQWEDTTLYLTINRVEGVLQDIDYSQTVNKDSEIELKEALADSYVCKGFIPDGYLTFAV
jgi:hypothetical protein